jgi:hypothetical protein
MTPSFSQKFAPSNCVQVHTTVRRIVEMDDFRSFHLLTYCFVHMCGRKQHDTLPFLGSEGHQSLVVLEHKL